MATIKELRLRIKSLKNTQKITSAMKLVSASKMKKAQEAIHAAGPYTEKMKQIIDRVAASSDEIEHPLLQSREVQTVRYYLFTSDKGLCGSFNNALLRFFDTSVVDNSIPNVEAVGVGARASQFLKRTKAFTPSHLEQSHNKPDFANATHLAETAISDFQSGKVDRVVLVFNEFRSVLSQKPMTLQLLPMVAQSNPNGDSSFSASPSSDDSSSSRADYLFEPDPIQLFAYLLPKMVTVHTFRALLETAAGEHGARMTAMDSATNNTKDLIGSLTLKMNRARQAAITTELTEIVSGAEAL